MPKVRKIKVLKGNPDGTLTLSDNGKSRAWKEDSIVWEVLPGSGVEFLESIELKQGTTDVFQFPPIRYGTGLTGVIKSDVRRGDNCTYTIKWVGSAETGKIMVFDPIITIRPSLLDVIDIFDNPIGLASGTIVGAVATYMLQRAELLAGPSGLLAGALIGGILGWLFLRRK